MKRHTGDNGNRNNNGNNWNRGRPQRKPRFWKAPRHLSGYERSVWLLNSFTGREVSLRNYESHENLIKRFKRKIEHAGVMGELKRREYYLTRTQKEREKHKKALKRLRKMHKRQDGEDVDPKMVEGDLMVGSSIDDFSFWLRD